ncbi:sensor histidine kinase [Marinobacterium jannaschii]|uniref:sensor histidine kinase n=1 Tax=Marinobacterium jannaschii TaxID=64970 RepID=UPI000684984F|nr:ATP-binding protein [Marinobacterium jannaschii]
MMSLHSQVVDQLGVGVLVVDSDYVIAYWNNFMADNTRHENSDIVGMSLFQAYPELPEVWLRRRLESVFLLRTRSFTNWQQRPFIFRFPSSRPITGTSKLMYQSCTLFPICDGNRQVSHVCITVADVTATAVVQTQLKNLMRKLDQDKRYQQDLNQKLEEAQNQLLQSEKLASIGQLAAGVAHEINNPVGFIKSNLLSLRDYVKDLGQALEQYDHLIDSSDVQLQAKRDALRESLDLDFITSDLGSMLEETFDGIERIEGIVRSLKDFSRGDNAEWQWSDINQGLLSTLKIVQHEIKYVVSEVRQDLADLPRVYCIPAQLNQVFMNLMVNAAQAMDDNGVITISTRVDAGYVVIRVSDTGRGIDPAHLERIFDPFFTTKPVGEGTGLGLSVSYGIVQAHAGELTVQSQPGQGTVFTIRLPLAQDAGAEKEVPAEGAVSL